MIAAGGAARAARSTAGRRRAAAGAPVERLVERRERELDPVALGPRRDLDVGAERAAERLAEPRRPPRPGRDGAPPRRAADA